MLLHALPFALSLTFIPFVILGLTLGGWWVIACMIYAFLAIPSFDYIVGVSKERLDPRTDERRLIFHRLITWIWVPIQIVLIFGTLATIGTSDRLTGWEILGIAVAVGVITGGIGITYAHELMHQTGRFERSLSEILMTSTLYGHFCLEHVYGHHIRVATPEDPASARYGESFWAFLPRTMLGSFISAWRIQAARMARRNQPAWHVSNPFWRYGMAYVIYITTAYALAGWIGVGVFCLQAFVAIMLLELVNYVEHYGLARKRLDHERYERVQPHHSWNASHKLTNYFLINLQRHSDHHKHPQRRYPVLQHYDESEAPQLPFGYPTMLIMAVVPPLWFWLMNPRVDRWRERYYPA